MQHLAARLRQGEGGEEEHAVGRDGKDRDRVGKYRRGERADEEWKQRADAAAEIVAEAAARSAEPRRMEFREECADARAPLLLLIA